MNSIDNFGKIDSIQLHTVWDLDPFRDASIELLANDPSSLVDLYESGINSKILRRVRFPQSIELTVEYPQYTQVWECFQTQEWIDSLHDNINAYGSIVDNWASAKIETTSTGRCQELWTKTVYGLKFHIYSLTHKVGT